MCGGGLPGPPGGQGWGHLASGPDLSLLDYQFNKERIAFTSLKQACGRGKKKS